MTATGLRDRAPIGLTGAGLVGASRAERLVDASCQVVAFDTDSAIVRQLGR